jgi:hypothetical protein
MAFMAALHPGRPAAFDRVAAVADGARMIRFFLSPDIAEHILGSAGRVLVSLGTGKHHGMVLITPTSADHGAHCFKVGRQIAFNVSAAYLGRCAPRKVTALGHWWHEDGLIADVRSLPIATEQPHGKRPRGLFELDPDLAAGDRGGARSHDADQGPGGRRRRASDRRHV